MARRKVKHTLELTIIEEEVAICKVTDNTVAEGAIRLFCEIFAVPISEQYITDYAIKYAKIKTALDQAEKTKPKK